MRVAASVAQHKAAKPHLYCPERRCLWRTVEGNPSPPYPLLGPRCPRHPARTTTKENA